MTTQRAVAGEIERAASAGRTMPDVGADHRDELTEHAHPHRQGRSRRHSEEEQDQEGEQAGDDGQHRSRVDIAAGLVDRDLPDVQRLALSIGRHHRQQRAPPRWALGDEVIGEKGNRHHLEDGAEDGVPDGEHPARHRGAILLQDASRGP